MKRAKLTMLLLTLPALWLPKASAFDNGPSWFDFHTTLQPSSARSLSMGGAAVATVDDASAVLDNPAALALLSKAQILFDSAYLYRRALEQPGASNLGSGDSIRLGLSADANRQLKPALMALATPLAQGRAAIGLFYHKLLPYDRTIRVSDPLSDALVETHRVMFDIDEFGVSLAHSLFDGRLALGVSASLVTLNMDFTTRRDPNPGTGDFDGVEFSSYGSQSEQEPQWRFGLLYRPSEAFAIGLRHTIAPNLDYTLTTANGPETVEGAPASGCNGDINLGVLSDGTPTGSWVCKSSLPLPEYTSLGAAYSPNPVWTFAVEATYVDYARMTKEFNSPYAYPGGDVTVVQSPQDFEAETVIEVHLGVEYRIREERYPFALRGGYYFDPAHDIKYRGDDATSQAIYTGGDNVHHFSAGLGVDFGVGLQLDLAYDLADDHSQRGAFTLAYSY